MFVARPVFFDDRIESVVNQHQIRQRFDGFARRFFIVQQAD